MNIDWNEKPEWADVWIEDLEQPTNSGWHKEETDSFVDEKGLHYEKLYMDATETVYYPPETKPEWIGGGIPPVGTVCEYTKPDGYMNRERVWFKCYVVAHDQGGVVIRTEKNHYHLRKTPEYIFRPIKSDKEKWIDQARKSFVDANVGRLTMYEMNCIDAIYDALISGELPMPKGGKL